MAVDEVSSFQLAEEEEREQEHKMQIEDLKQARSETLAQRESLTQKFAQLSIDSQAVKFFFKTMRQMERNSFWETLQLTAEIISTEYEQTTDDYKQLMCIRGLLLLLLNDQVADAMS